MSYRYHGRARVTVGGQTSFAICDRCGFLYNHNDLHWAYDYRGPNLANLRILVCDICTDIPQNQLRPKITPPDPRPTENPRFEPYAIDEK